MIVADLSCNAMKVNALLQQTAAVRWLDVSCSSSFSFGACEGAHAVMCDVL